MSSLFDRLRDSGGLRLPTSEGRLRDDAVDDSLAPPEMMQTIAAAQRILETMTPEQKEEGWKKILQVIPPGEAEEAAIGIALDESITYDEARYMLLAMVIAGTASSAAGHDLPFKSLSAPAPMRAMDTNAKRKKSKGKK
jgi:hypothetical protein